MPIPNLFLLMITNGDNVIYHIKQTLNLGDGEFKATTSFCHFNGGGIILSAINAPKVSRGLHTWGVHQKNTNKCDI